MCHAELGEKNEAEAAFRKALALDRKRGGSDDEFGLTHQHNLASFLGVIGQHEEAEALYRNVIGKMKDPARRACVLTNFGGHLYETKRAIEAVTLLKQAKNIAIALFPPGHPEVGKIGRHLAVAQKKAATERRSK